MGPAIILYLVVGIAVAFTVYLTLRGQRVGERMFQVLTATMFWPLYVPLLLARKRSPEPEPAAPATVPPDEMASAIAQVEVELEAALQSLDGWAEDVLAREKDRLHELRHAWSAQAERIREMDRLLGGVSSLEFQVSNSQGQLHPRAETRLQGQLETRNLKLETATAAERWQLSKSTRRQNLDRLREVRERTYQDLMGTLAWVRELVSMIHLAKFTGAPASRAEELVAQIAAAVEGLSALTWQVEPLVSAGDST